MPPFLRLFLSILVLSSEDCRVLRESLFSLVKFLVFKDSNQKDMDTLLTVALTVKNEGKKDFSYFFT